MATNLPTCPQNTIETPRLTLRAFSAMLKPSLDTRKILEDHYLQFFYRMRRQPAVMQWSLEGTADDSPAKTESWLLARVDRRWGFVVERKLDPANVDAADPTSGTETAVVTEPIGSMAIRMPVENEKGPNSQVEYPELGFMFDETFHGKGYATEAVRALLESFWAETEACDIVQADVRPENQASLRVVAKCGFEFWRHAGKYHVYRVTRPARQVKQR